MKGSALVEAELDHFLIEVVAAFGEDVVMVACGDDVELFWFGGEAMRFDEFARPDADREDDAEPAGLSRAHQLVPGDAERVDRGGLAAEDNGAER